MIMRKLSIRLGMHQSLYLGICIGFIAAALVTLSEYYLLSLGKSQIIAAALALIGGSLLVMGIIFHSQRSYLAAADQVCTCRYRRGIHTLCVKCAMYPETEHAPAVIPGQKDD